MSTSLRRPDYHRHLWKRGEKACTAALCAAAVGLLAYFFYRSLLAVVPLSAVGVLLFFRIGKEKGKKGLVVLSSQKKRGFLSDPAYMRYKGFKTADTAEPYFELLYLPFDESTEKPRFKNTVHERSGMTKGFVLLFTNQCPFTAKYVPLLENVAKARGAALQVIPIRTREEAQNAPSPFTTFSLFYDGQLVTHEILSEKKFESILISKGM